MPLDHFSITVPTSSVDGVAKFLVSSLGHMGFKEFVRPIPTVVGLGDSKPWLWISGKDAENGDQKSQEALLKGTHVALTAENGQQVKDFHAAALKAGGICNGEPGIRAYYHPGYYAAFVFDPVCALNIEVVCHTGE